METFGRFRVAFAQFSVFFWPWIWLQLREIDAFTKRTGQTVLFHFDDHACLVVRFIADAPGARGRRYHHDAPRTPAWQRPALSSDLPPCLEGIAPLHAAGGLLQKAAHLSVIVQCAAPRGAWKRPNLIPP